MAELFRQKRVNSVSDDTVKAKTGKTWEEWYKILEKSGARMMQHDEIARFAHKQLGLTRWWGSLLAVGYEQEHGMREPYQRDIGSEVDRSRTMAAPRAAVWAAFNDRALLDRWLPGLAFEVHKSTPDRILILNWPDDTRVTVTLTQRSAKTKVAISHEKVPGLEEVRRLQDFWAEALERLRIVVEG